MHRENSPDSTGYYSISELEPKTQEVLLDDGQPYIYSTGVEKHLLERGFNITAGSDFVLIPAGSKLQMSETPTMFDEIRGNREFKLSVNKLLSGKALKIERDMYLMSYRATESWCLFR
jgi:hypothetical protein